MVIDLRHLDRHLCHVHKEGTELTNLLWELAEQGKIYDFVGPIWNCLLMKFEVFVKVTSTAEFERKEFTLTPYNLNKIKEYL